MSNTVIELNEGTSKELIQVLKGLKKEVEVFVFNEQGELVVANALVTDTEFQEFSIEKDKELEDQAAPMDVESLLIYLKDSDEPDFLVYVWDEEGGKMNPIHQIELTTQGIILQS